MAEETKPSGVTSTSSTGPNGPMPAELNRWNWGAFFLTWIWAIGNSVWIGLLALIGPIALIMAIVLGVKGSEWAWQNRKFKDVEEFKAVQKAWSTWGIILFCVSLGLGIIMTILSATLGIFAVQEAASTIPTSTSTVQSDLNLE